MDRLNDISKIPSVEALERVQGLRDRGQNQDKTRTYEGPKPGEDDEPVGEEESQSMDTALESTEIEEPEKKKKGDASCQDGGADKGRIIDIKA